MEGGRQPLIRYTTKKTTEGANAMARQTGKGNSLKNKNHIFFI